MNERQTCFLDCEEKNELNGRRDVIGACEDDKDFVSWPEEKGCRCVGERFAADIQVKGSRKHGRK